jgi:hypothetical protein
VEKIFEALGNAQGWIRETARRLESVGAAKEVASVRKALKLLEQVESDLFVLLVQQEEIRKLLNQ